MYATFSILAKDSSKPWHTLWRNLAKNHGFALLGNFAACVFASAFFGILTGFFDGDPNVFREWVIAMTVARCQNTEFFRLFFSGVLGAVYVCFATLMALAADDISSKMLACLYRLHPCRSQACNDLPRTPFRPPTSPPRRPAFSVQAGGPCRSVDAVPHGYPSHTSPGPLCEQRRTRCEQYGRQSGRGWVGHPFFAKLDEWRYAEHLGTRSFCIHRGSRITVTRTNATHTVVSTAVGSVILFPEAGDVTNNLPQFTWAMQDRAIHKGERVFFLNLRVLL